MLSSTDPSSSYNPTCVLLLYNEWCLCLTNRKATKILNTFSYKLTQQALVLIPPPTPSKCTARVVAYQRINISPSSTLRALLEQLHWLPNQRRVWFKLANLVFKTTLNRPPYLTDLIFAIIRFSSAGITCHWDLAVSVSLHHISGIHCLSTFAKSSQFLHLGVIWVLTSFSQPFLPTSNPPANAPRFF